MQESKQEIQKLFPLCKMTDNPPSENKCTLKDFCSKGADSFLIYKSGVYGGQNYIGMFS